MRFEEAAGCLGIENSRVKVFQGRMVLALMRVRVGPQLSSRGVVLHSAGGETVARKQAEAWPG